MRKRMWSTAATLVVLLSGGGVIFGGPRVLAADGSRVAMIDSDSDAMKWRFEPAEVTVPVGSTVVWHNGGNQAHTVTADDGKSFDSPNVASGADYQFKFATAGDYAYHCSPHPWMKGVVHVAGASTPTTAAPATPTTQPASPGTTVTSAPPARTGAAGAPTTTTAVQAAASATTTTTLAGTATAPTTTTLAPASTPTSAPEAAATTTTTVASAAAPKVEEGAESGRRRSNQGKSSPVGIAFAAVSTLLLTAIAAKLLASKP